MDLLNDKTSLYSSVEMVIKSRLIMIRNYLWEKMCADDKSFNNKLITANDLANTDSMIDGN